MATLRTGQFHRHQTRRGVGNSSERSNLRAESLHAIRSVEFSILLPNPSELPGDRIGSVTRRLFVPILTFGQRFTMVDDSGSDLSYLGFAASLLEHHLIGRQQFVLLVPRKMSSGTFVVLILENGKLVLGYGPFLCFLLALVLLITGLILLGSCKFVKTTSILLINDSLQIFVVTPTKITHFHCRRCPMTHRHYNSSIYTASTTMRNITVGETRFESIIFPSSIIQKRRSAAIVSFKRKTNCVSMPTRIITR